MQKFRKAKFKDIMHGPKIELDGFILEISLCPKGWKSKEHMTCYLELIQMDDNIKYIGMSVVMYIKEFDLLYKKGAVFKELDGLAANSKLFPYHKVKDIQSLTFEYNIEILYVEYKQESNIKLQPLVLCSVPEIEDTEFIWNIDDDLLEKLKILNLFGFIMVIILWIIV